MSDTRTRIVRAGVRLFAEQGFEGVSVGEIEAEAGLTPRAGGFYRHFKSKEELLLTILRAEINSAENLRFGDLLDLGDTRAELIAVGKAYLRWYRETKDVGRLMLRESNKLPHIQREIEKANRVNQAVLAEWIGAKNYCASMSKLELQELTMMMFGGWLFFLTKKYLQEVTFKGFSEESYLISWASHWAGVLDGEGEGTR